MFNINEMADRMAFHATLATVGWINLTTWMWALGCSHLNQRSIARGK
ncbi:hypothetical protein GALL_503280 [mine drainage metagenome]|uniref:Uncharacterized protein n=1 Tax=mine drainage metagenome TaxID=410659 RepID=A0A1J5P9W9_9ZZZZ